MDMHKNARLTPHSRAELVRRVLEDGQTPHGLAVRFMATHIRQTDGPSMSAILVRAEDNYGHFAPDRPPAGELDAAALAAHDRAMAPHASEGYATA